MGILDGIVDWLATQVMNLLDLASTSVLGALDCNMDTFKRYFPAASAMYEIFIWTAIGLVLLNLVWQLYRCYGAGFDIDTENPTNLVVRSVIFLLLIWYCDDSVTDVEIGGGKIQGREIVPGRGQIQFAMYNAHQYEKPEGHFTEQTSRDGEKWYKVYATTRVEKTPTVQDERGRMQYDERKVAAMPKAPARRH